MDNQHRQIEGYQELDAEKIRLFNQITEEGKRLDELCSVIRSYNIIEAKQKQIETGEVPVFSTATSPDRWAAMAATDFQTGLMFLKRSLAKPTTF